MVSRVNVVSHNEYSVFFLACPLFIGLACGDGSGPRDVRGALAASAEALEARDSDRFFKLLDERTRFAAAAIVTARTAAKALIQADYPPEERARALAALGDAALVSTPQELFRRRCGAACLQRFADVVGAPVAQEAQGDEIAVTTVRGAILHMHAGSDGGYGIVWNTQALSDERAQASRELKLIGENAAVYRRRRELEMAGERRAHDQSVNVNDKSSGQPVGSSR
jgi:hypothetical protein